MYVTKLGIYPFWQHIAKYSGVHCENKTYSTAHDIKLLCECQYQIDILHPKTIIYSYCMQ